MSAVALPGTQISQIARIPQIISESLRDYMRRHLSQNRVAIQDSSRGWSERVTHGMSIGFIHGIGASASVAFCITVGVRKRQLEVGTQFITPSCCFPNLIL